MVVRWQEGSGTGWDIVCKLYVGVWKSGRGVTAGGGYGVEKHVEDGVMKMRNE